MSVEIQLTDKYWLVSDTYSWAIAVQRKSGKTAGQFKQLAWFGSIGDLLESAYQRELRDSDAKTLEDLAKHAGETRHKLAQAVESLGSYQAVKSA